MELGPRLRGDGRGVAAVPALVLGCAGLVLVAVVGIGSATPLWDIGGPSQVADVGSYLESLVVLVPVVVAATSAALILTTMLEQRRRRADDPVAAAVRRRVPLWAAVLLLFALLVSTGLLSLVPPGERATPVVRRAPPGGGPASDGAKAGDGRLPGAQWWVIAGLALGAVAATAAVVRRRRFEELREESPALIAAIDLSVEDLESEPDARHAVIRAYGRMETALGQHGLPRGSSETPLEYLARALSSLLSGGRSVDRLTALFERAKFSRHTIDAGMKAEALAALAQLRDELAKPT